MYSHRCGGEYHVVSDVKYGTGKKSVVKYYCSLCKKWFNKSEVNEVADVCPECLKMHLVWDIFVYYNCGCWCHRG